MDVLIRGGTVVTMDPDQTIRRADVLVRDGRIAAIGRSASRARPVRVLDASGAAVMPGFVQCHVHLCQALFRGMADDLPLLAWLRERIWPLEAAHDPKSLRASARLGVAEMLRAGTTTILDMGTVHHQDAVFEVMRDTGIRGFSGKAMMDRGRGVPAGLKETTRESLRESERLFDAWHGEAAGRLGYAFAPRFILSCSEKLLRKTADLAVDREAIIHSHAAEHPDERQAVRDALGKDDVDLLSDYGIRGPRTVLAHGVQLTFGQMRRAAKHGTRFVHCPSANLKLSSGIAQVARMRSAGMVVGLGADGAPCNNRMDPFTELREAAILAKAQAQDAAALPASEALAMATIDGARVLGLEHLIGSLEVGKLADIAVVSIEGTHAQPGGDVVSRLVYSCTADDVRHVLVNGDILVERSELTRLDEERVRANAKRQAKKVLGRAFP
jgi:cytosine/adenosine deaminase-related metal-dependent hydrolase